MNARFKNLVGSKRKSSSHQSSPNTQGGSTPTGSNRPTSLSPQASNSSSSSLPMNPPNNLGRPPSYTFAQGGLAPGQQQHVRPTSPLPPINTGAPGYPTHPQQPVGYPPQGGPPGYPPQPPPGQYGAGYGAPLPPVPAAHGPPAVYNRPGMAEVAGEGRSKAQLIVGIDFVSS